MSFEVTICLVVFIALAAITLFYFLSKVFEDRD